MTLATVAVKPVLVAPAETVTEAGTVTAPLLLDNVTEAPPPGAPCVRVTVQDEVPGAFTVVGLQEMPLRVGLETPVTVILPPVPLVGTLVPLGALATTLVTAMLITPDALPERVAFTTASVPLAIAV